jgi:hypothetical protein
VKCYIWSIAYGTETWTFLKVDQKYLENFEMWCWKRREKISWTVCVEERNVLHTIQQRKANWIGHMLRRNCILKHVIEGKIGKARRGRRLKQLLDDLRETRRYWNLKEEAVDRTLLRTRFGRRYGPGARQTA